MSCYAYICIEFNTLKYSAMKSFGSVLSFTRERNAALLKAYREQVDTTSFIRLNEIGEKIVNSLSPRF